LNKFARYRPSHLRYVSSQDLEQDALICAIVALADDASSQPKILVPTGLVVAPTLNHQGIRFKGLVYGYRKIAEPLRSMDAWIVNDNRAAAVHLSPRQFSRVFQDEIDQSPAKAIENLRTEVARLILEDSRHSIDVIARETALAAATAGVGPLFASLDKRPLRSGEKTIGVDTRQLPLMFEQTGYKVPKWIRKRATPQ
jgi:AraC-like DNA-binding protein